MMNVSNIIMICIYYMIFINDNDMYYYLKKHVKIIKFANLIPGMK